MDEKNILLAQAQAAKSNYQMLMAVASERRKEAKEAKDEAEGALALHMNIMDKIAELDRKN